MAEPNRDEPTSEPTGVTDAALDVLLLGDSITVQYCPYLEQMASGCRIRSLGDHAQALRDLDRPQGANRGGSDRLLETVGMLGDAGLLAADLVVMNAGLHDIKRSTPDGPTQISMEQYRTNVSAALQRVQEAGAQALWVLTTPVCDHVHNQQHHPGFFRRGEDVRRYNAAACQVAARLDVPILSFDPILILGNAPSAEAYQRLFVDHVHLCEAARQRQAAMVAGWITAWRWRRSCQSQTM